MAEYLNRYLHLDSFLPDKVTNEIAVAAANAGYQEAMSKWDVAKKIVIYAMGVEGKTLGELMEYSEADREKLARRFAEEIKKRPYNGAEASELTAQQLKENVQWYGKMYANCYQQLLKKKQKFFEAGVVDKAGNAKEFQNSEVYLWMA